jgi:hypothetical protein
MENLEAKHLGLVRGESRTVTESLGSMLRSIASLAKNFSSNIGKVSRFEGLLAGGATEAMLSKKYNQ